MKYLYVSKIFLEYMKKLRVEACRRQFPDCPEDINELCKKCPYYDTALKNKDKLFP
tara:strand:- start:1202 stop:1369 length:168 start_codon:yes stop_codon:yes gene_type:complete